MRRIPLTGLILAGAVFCTGSVYGEEISIQPTPIELKAVDVLPGNLLTGPRHQVEPDVTSDGFVNTYKLTTFYGALTVRSTALLEERIKEVNALYLMESLEKSTVFKDALKESAKGPFKTAKGLVTEPINTVTNTVTGVGRWFSDVGRSVFSGDEHQEGVMKTALGQAPAKRTFAYEFGVDPYSNWEPLQEKLNSVAWAATGGGLTVRVAFHAIPESAGLIVRATGTADGMRKLVRDKSVGELKKINRKKLEEMNIPKDVIGSFLDNPYYTPQETTLLVGELETMRRVEGRDIFVRRAARANSASIALFMRLRAQMMASYAANIARVTRFVDLDGVPFFRRGDGSIIGLAPLDYVAWTHELWRREWSASDEISKAGRIPGKEFWISGTVSSSARTALEAKGWKIVDRVGYMPKK